MIRAVTESLVDFVHNQTPDLGSWVIISSLSNADSDPTKDRLAVAMFAVEEHPHLRNRPLVSTPAGYVRPALSLRLHYLMTYVGPHDEAQTRLARVVQVFHTTPILQSSDLRSDLVGLVDRVTVRLRSTDADERNQIWGALGRAARLALFYEVDVAPVEALEREGRGQILEHRIDYAEMS